MRYIISIGATGEVVGGSGRAICFEWREGLETVSSLRNRGQIGCGSLWLPLSSARATQQVWRQAIGVVDVSWGSAAAYVLKGADWVGVPKE